MVLQLKKMVTFSKEHDAFKSLPKRNPGTLKYLSNGQAYREYVRTSRELRIDSVKYPEDFNDPSSKNLLEAFDLFGYRKVIIKIFLDPVTLEAAFSKFEYYG